MFHHNRHGGITFERGMTCDHFIEHNAKAVNISVMIHILPNPLFWSHVSRRSDADSSISEFSQVFRVQSFCNPKIRDHQFSGFGAQNICGFDITMDDILGVGIIKGTCNGDQLFDSVLPGNGGSQAFFERTSRDIFHHQKWQTILGAIVDHVDDIRMRETGN